MCWKKIFASKHAARTAHRYAHYRVRPYWCHSCNGWHVTNAEKR